MFIPTTREEMDRLGWDRADILLVSGDTYTDNSYNGTALVGHWLMDHGYRVGIIAQPRVNTGEDISRLGRPRLFWSVSAGCVDSMVANYTPTRKFRKEDDFTPGGVNDRRPDRACIAYTNLIKRHCKGEPVFLAGVEASLRRIAHYDFWSDSVRRSVLFDAKADGIVYGMGELTNLQIAERLDSGDDWRDLRGVCHASSSKPDGCVEMPSYEEVSRRDDRRAFMRAFSILRHNSDPVTARQLCQAHGNRWLVQNRPQRCMTTEELDAAYESSFENRVHPFYAGGGRVAALDTVRNSVTTHRGCYGDCSFCAIAAHQGTTVVSRSHDSIMREVRRMAASEGFDGVIRDVGGATANMYGIECTKKLSNGRCEDRRCLGGRPCPRLPIDHSEQIRLLDDVSSVDGVRRVFIASGIRHDMVLADRRRGGDYLDRVVSEHVSGQMKVAPEHVCDDVLRLMGKPGRDALLGFKGMFTEGAKHILGWKSPHYVYNCNLAPNLKLLLRDFNLSDDISLRFSNPDWSEYPLFADKYIAKIAAMPEAEQVINICMDLSAFGMAQPLSSNILEFLKAIPACAAEKSMTFSTPSEIIAGLAPASSIDVPYPISWCDEERDTSPWEGNVMQREALDKLYGIAERVRLCNNRLIKQDWEQKQSYDVLNNLNEVMKKEECFQAIPCNVAQQTIRMVQKVYKGFFKLIKAKEEMISMLKGRGND